ncbi:2857_t:CDS:1, partial [Acaulospora morrowiae]
KPPSEDSSTDHKRVLTSSGFPSTIYSPGLSSTVAGKPARYVKIQIPQMPAKEENREQNIFDQVEQARHARHMSRASLSGSTRSAQTPNRTTFSVNGGMQSPLSNTGFDDNQLLPVTEDTSIVNNGNQKIPPTSEKTPDKVLQKKRSQTQIQREQNTRQQNNTSQTPTEDKLQSTPSESKAYKTSSVQNAYNETPSKKEPTPTIHAPSRKELTPTSHTPSKKELTPTGHVPLKKEFTPTGHAPSKKEFTPTGHAPSKKEFTPTGHAPSKKEFTPTSNVPLKKEPTPTNHAPVASIISRQLSENSEESVEKFDSFMGDIISTELECEDEVLEQEILVEDSEEEEREEALVAEWLLGTGLIFKSAMTYVDIVQVYEENFDAQNSEYYDEDDTEFMEAQENNIDVCYREPLAASGCLTDE